MQAGRVLEVVGNSNPRRMMVQDRTRLTPYLGFFYSSFLYSKFS